MKIGVFGHVGNQNLGDEALVAAVLQNVRRRRPDAQVCGFTGRPQDTKHRHGVEAFPIRRGASARPKTEDRRPRAPESDRPAWHEFLTRSPRLRALARAMLRSLRAIAAIPLELVFLVQSARRLRGVDLLLVAGSAQLSDYWGGPWGFPFTLWKWSLLARLTGTRVALLSVGAGPLRTPLGRFFIRQTVQLAQYRSYRDEDSRECVVRLGIPGDHPVVPDLVFSLDLMPPPVTIREKPKVVGINPMPVGDDHYWPERDPAAYAHYLDVMASFADWLLDRGYQVHFFPTQLLVDGGVIDEVKRRMKSAPVTERVESIEDLVKAIDGLDVVVATRYHGTVFSLIRRRPVLSVAYQAKSVEVMRQLGLDQYAVEIGKLTLTGLQERLNRLEGERQQVIQRLSSGLGGMSRLLATQYDQVLAEPASTGRRVFNEGSTVVSPALRPFQPDAENTM